MELILLVTLLGALLAIAVVLLVPARDSYFVLAKGLVLGCTLFLLIAANPQAYRLELVFVPVCVIGLAILAQRLLGTDTPDFRRKEVERR